ncbi:MAG TPA: zf-HC2 domain-containing protein, partial [Polyangia bacterium]
MSEACVGSDRLARHADGELTVNEAAAVAKHLAGCADCRKELALVRDLLGHIAARPVVKDEARAQDQFVAGVLERIEAQRLAEKPHRGWSFPWSFPWRLPTWTWGAALAAATAVVLLPRVAQHRRGNETDIPEFASRGGDRSQPALPKRVGAEIQVIRDGKILASEETRLRAADRLTARYDNLVTDRPIYLMVFALDAAGDVHWIFPGYTDATSDPEAVLLERGARARALGEVVQLEAPAAGALRVAVL